MARPQQKDKNVKITINGAEKEIPKPLQLKKLIEQFCANSNHVVAEVNGTIIKKSAWGEKVISEGDTLELVTVVGGG